MQYNNIMQKNISFLSITIRYVVACAIVITILVIGSNWIQSKRKIVYNNHGNQLEELDRFESDGDTVIIYSIDYKQEHFISLRFKPKTQKK